MVSTRTSPFFALSTEGEAEYRHECKPDTFTWTVLLKLCQYADWQTHVWTGRLGFLTDATGLDRTTVNRRLKVLAEDSSIQIVRPFSRGDDSPLAQVYVCAYDDLHQSQRPGRMSTASTNDLHGMSTASTNDQGTFSHTLGTSANTSTRVPDGGGADEAGRAAGSSHEPSHQDWVNARAIVAAKKAAGEPITTEPGLIRWLAFHPTAAMRKSRKGTSKPQNASEGLKPWERRVEGCGDYEDETRIQCAECKDYGELDEHPHHRVMCSHAL